MTDTVHRRQDFPKVMRQTNNEPDDPQMTTYLNSVCLYPGTSPELSNRVFFIVFYRQAGHHGAALATLLHQAFAAPSLARTRAPSFQAKYLPSP